MTPSRSDSLVFKLAGNDPIPCSADSVHFEFVGEAAQVVDAELLRNAAAAVLHFFRTELHRESVPAAEFIAALEKVLHGFGLTHLRAAPDAAAKAPQMTQTDLCTLAGDGIELMFFQRLREELRRNLQPAPRVLHFHGLRPCVKQLAGARRWSPRCQALNDQIVEYLRTSLSAEQINRPCGLVVR
jgi:hypothetical protein